MDQISSIKELSDSRVDVLLGLIECVRAIGKLGRIRVVESQFLASVRAIVQHPVVPAFPILVCEDLSKVDQKEMIIKCKISLTLLPAVVVVFFQNSESLNRRPKDPGSLA